MKFEAFVNRSYVAQSPNADCEETINLFLETAEAETGKSQKSFYRSPGLAKLGTLGSGPIRGIFPLNRLPGGADGAWIASGDTMYEMDANFVIQATRGPIPNDGKTVSMAASLLQLGLVSAGDVYYIDGIPPFLHGPVTWMGAGVKIADLGILNTYFLLLDKNSGDRFYFSEPGGDITNGNPLNFITIEASANKYIKMLVDREQIWVYGTLLAQVFNDVSASNPANPFAPDFSAVLPIGTAAATSVTSLSGRIYWIGKSSTMVGAAYTNDGGFVQKRISNHAIEYQWSTYSKIDDARGWGFTMKGHPLWRIYFPSADVTWEYDALENDWRKVLSWNSSQGQYHAHKGVYAASVGNQIWIGDKSNGNVYRCSMDLYNDDGDILRWLRRSPILTNENKRTSFPWFELDIESGVGDGSNLDPLLGPVTPEADPQIMMRYSNDWSKTWSNERMRSMGKQGEYTKRVIWQRNGTGRQRVFEASGTASVKLAINGCYLRDPIGRRT